MKVLKRPMFRYGGGVKKQGIMHGMKGMQDGGPATMADATGYANGGMTMFPPMRGRVTRPGGYAGKRPNYMGGPIQNFYESISDITKIMPSNMTGQEIKDKYNFDFPINPKSIFTADNPELQNTITKGEDTYIIPGQKPIYRTSPKYSLGQGDTQGSIGDIDQGKYSSNFDTSKFTPKPTNKPLNAPDAVKGLPKISREETDAKRLKRIYEIMDVDGAKKDAAYNALIDLSQGQAIDTKDISGSINRAIGALSKRADKVTDLKDKGKAALASGTVQEMFRDDRSSQLKVAQEMVEAGIYKTLPEALKAVVPKQADTNLGSLISAESKSTAGTKITEKSIQSTLQKSKEGQPKFQLKIFTEEEMNKKIEAGEFKDPLDIVIKTQEIEKLTPGDKSKDGRYQVGKTVILVKDGKASVEYGSQIYSPQ